MAMTDEEKEQKIQKYMQEHDVSYKKAALKIYSQRLKAKDPETYEKIKKTRGEYQKKWRARNPAYNRRWGNTYYKKHPEKQKEYQRRCCLKKALQEESGEGSENTIESNKLKHKITG